jgi:hypothetical protein
MVALQNCDRAQGNSCGKGAGTAEACELGRHSTQWQSIASLSLSSLSRPHTFPTSFSFPPSSTAQGRDRPGRVAEAPQPQAVEKDY